MPPDPVIVTSGAERSRSTTLAMSASRPIGELRSRGKSRADAAGVGAHVGHEVVPAGVDGLDDPLCLPVVPDRPAGGLDPGRQRRFGHETITPDRVEQLLLRDDAVAVDDQIAEHLEHLGLDMDGSRRPGERVQLVVQLELSELKAHAVIVPQRVPAPVPPPRR